MRYVGPVGGIVFALIGMATAPDALTMGWAAVAACWACLLAVVLWANRH